MVGPKITFLIHIHIKKFCTLRAHNIGNEYQGSVTIPTYAFKSFS